MTQPTIFQVEEWEKSTSRTPRNIKNNMIVPFLSFTELHKTPTETYVTTQQQQTTIQ